MNFILKVYDKVKYLPDSTVETEVCYREVKSMTMAILAVDEVRKLGFDETDPFGEYVTFHFANGADSTFRNSFVDVFKV